MVFDTSLAQLFDEEPAPAEGLPRIYIYAIAVAAALVVGTVILIIARRRREAQMAELLEQEPSVALETAPAISPELLARQRSRENVERLARTNPQLVATLIKSWLLEDER
jgi:flagellar M-ring protein FliF